MLVGLPGEGESSVDERSSCLYFFGVIGCRPGDLLVDRGAGFVVMMTKAGLLLPASRGTGILGRSRRRRRHCAACGGRSSCLIGMDGRGMTPRIDRERVLGRLDAFNRTGAVPGGGKCRLAPSDEDRAGRLPPAPMRLRVMKGGKR